MFLVAYDVTLSETLQSLSVFVATIFATLLLRRALVRWGTFHDSRHIRRVLGRFLSVVIVVIAVIGLIYALDILGVHIGPVVGALGIGGIALAFAAQDALATSSPA